MFSSCRAFRNLDEDFDDTTGDTYLATNPLREALALTPILNVPAALRLPMEQGVQLWTSGAPSRTVVG